MAGKTKMLDRKGNDITPWCMENKKARDLDDGDGVCIYKKVCPGFYKDCLHDLYMEQIF